MDKEKNTPAPIYKEGRDYDSIPSIKCVGCNDQAYGTKLFCSFECEKKFFDCNSD